MYVNATDITIWANSRASQDTLSKLVRRLVHATVQGVRKISFPAGEGVQLGGWDGIVEAQTGTAFVSAGTSGWELGTSEDVLKKANSDYKKRTADPLGLDPIKSTFVFVTARRWGGQSKVGIRAKT